MFEGMTYTTEQLLQILDEELKATWTGKRVLLSSEERLSNPVVAKALGSDKLSKVFAYQDFREQIHEYQREHSVSGIIWRTCTFRGETLHYPELHNQLIAIPGDKETLVEAKTAVLAFWEKLIPTLNLWLVTKDYIEITSDYFERLVEQTEWAEVDATLDALYLSLCWGKPEECRYQWARQASGCERVVAAQDKPTGDIKV
jgi:hypothetical protein